jgi:phosphatidylinositol alpha-mannosyltransferase
MSGSDSLKIGLVLDDTLDSQDGVQQMVVLLGRWLSSRGHEVHYLVAETSRDDIRNIHSLAVTKSLRFNGNTVRIPMPASSRDIRRLLAKLQLDVIHVQLPYSPMLGGKVIASVTNEVVVGTFHILPYGVMATVGTQLLGAIQSRTLKRLRASTATSLAAAEFAQTRYRLRPVVVPNPVDVARFRVRDAMRLDPDGPTRLVFLGRLVERKGAGLLLHAIDRLPVSIKQNLRVVVGGDGPKRAELEAYVATHRLRDIVSFAGRIAEDEKPAFLSQADIAVFPSTGGESFGIVLIEAMAAGAGVVVGGDNPGYRSVLGRWNECLVNPADTAAFAERLETLIANTKLRARLHQEQQKAVEQYDIGVVGSQFDALYRQAILDSQTELA